VCDSLIHYPTRNKNKIKNVELTKQEMKVTYQNH